jgi:hypothetical protein
LVGVTRWAKVVVIFSVLTAVALWLFLPNNKARRAVEETRRHLHAQGFRLALSEFDLSIPAEIRTNNETLVLAADASRNAFSVRRLDLMRPVNSNSAAATWSQDNPAADIINEYFWTDLRKSLAERKAELDRACEAVLSAPFRFKTTLTTNDELMPEVARARLLGSAFAARTIVGLRDQNHASAWTNLLALTRLITAWQTEPMEISHSIRFRWMATAHRATWEALQAKDWTDEELAQLQHEWEAPNFFTGLPETAAFARASTIAFCDWQRRQPPPRGPTLREFVSELVNSPNRAWSDATSGWRNARYRNYESYEDENAWLLFFRDCEVDCRRALAANSWSEIRGLPGATNSRPAQASGAVLGIDAARSTGPGGFGGYQRQGLTLLARAAEAEARRRVIITAIAVERFHLANHGYPDSLSKLVPDFLNSIPQDFMDGELLRYRRIDDGRYFLYSIGLDCIDDHGRLIADANSNSNPYLTGAGFGRFEGPDLVWPLAASAAEIQAYAQTPDNRRPRSPVRPMTPEGQPFRRYGTGSSLSRTNRLNTSR